VFVAGGLICTSAASAKDFEPGDLRVCNVKRCMPIEDRRVLRMLSSFYYGPGSPVVARPPRMGAPAFELRFDNGYATGIVASARLDRFLSYGVHLGHFRRGRWYTLPARVSLELRRLAAPLAPLPLTPAAVAKSR
jgi:hypothetical protein